MPTSKNRRKNGKTAKGGFKQYVSQRKAIARRSEKGLYVDIEQARRDAKCIAGRQKWRERGLSKMAWMNLLATEPGAIIEGQTKALLALDRWTSPEASEEDFNMVASTLMLGFLVAKRMPLENVEEIFSALHDAAFMVFVCARFFNRRHPIPEANLTAIRVGLDVAIELLLQANETDRHVLIEVLQHNDKDAVALSPAQHAEEQRQLLGRYAVTVEKWWIEDYGEPAPWTRAPKEAA